MSRVLFLLITVVTVTSMQIVHRVASAPTVDLAAFRKAELQRHNYYRARHGTPNISLDQNLNKIAQTYAESVAAAHKMAHSPSAANTQYGENIYWDWGSPSLTYILGSASDFWYSEIAYYDFETGLPNQEGKTINHFATMIWKTVTSVGFGFVSVKEDNGYAIYIMANYLPTPLLGGARTYIDNIPLPV